MKYYIIVLVLIIVLMVFSFCSSAGQDKKEEAVTVEQVKQKIGEKDPIILLDVRTVPEFDGDLGHIPGALLIPLAELESRITELEGYKKSEMILICRSGNRSGQATRFLREKGFNAYNMKGGMLAWNRMLETVMSDSTGEKDETISK
jgi:rhodanese-related sulfurtransferase